MTALPPILTLQRVTRSFGGLVAIRDLDVVVRRGEATALIGPNGAGKTTLFNIISGALSPDSGRILFEGADITELPSRRRIRCGIARSFQNVRLMPHLSVVENLMVGQHVRASGLRDLFVPFRFLPNHRWRRQAIEALADAGLEPWADAMVGDLPYGVRKRIDLVRATLAGASLLMLDEPAAGLNPSETQVLRGHIEALKARGVTLLVVEHDMHFIGQVCDHVVVLNFGEKIAEGTLTEVQRDDQVRAAYLGYEEVA